MHSFADVIFVIGCLSVCLSGTKMLDIIVWHVSPLSHQIRRRTAPWRAAPDPVCKNLQRTVGLRINNNIIMLKKIFKIKQTFFSFVVW